MWKIGSLKCLEKAKNLETNISQIRSFQLRNLDLNSSEVALTALILSEEKSHNSSFITSISFSYNQLIGDIGATAIVKSLPKSICEIGLVDCGIGDKGGTEILTWMKKSPQLQMICMEQNNFSETQKLEFHDFRRNNPNVMVVY